MKKIDRKTPDLAAENVAKLAALFPEVVKDGKVDAEALRAVIGEELEAGQEKFGLTWPGKRDAIKEALKRTQSTLRPQQGESVDWDATQNLFIEGDNLEVLRTLLDTYRGKVKMIYIDPPYNTGSDFVYNDTFKEGAEEFKQQIGEAMRSNPSTSGRYHSDWLSMMYPRLKLAKEYLTEDGIIFVSIDDYELTRLQHVLNEIFGEHNLVANFIWVKKTAPNNVVVGTVHDYILGYVKNIESAKLYLPPRNAERDSAYSNPDNDPRGSWKPDNITSPAKGGRSTPSLIYEIENPITGEKFLPPSGRMWSVPKDAMLQKIQDKSIYWGKDGRGRPMNKRFLSETRDGLVVPSVLTDVGSNSSASKELLGLFKDQVVFETPKPTQLITKFLNLSTRNNDLILDFFAGSCTTAHSIMQLNAEDGGNRRYICVQLPEETPEDSEARKAGYATISAISKERIRRAGKMVREEFADKLKERNTPLDTGFKSFTLDSSNLPEWDSQTKDLLSALKTQALGIKPDRSSEDVLYEVLLRYGVDIAATPVVKKTIAGKEVFDVGEGHMLVCLEENIDQAVVEAIAKSKPERVVFRDDGFKTDIVKLNAVETLKKAGIKEENVRVL